MYCRNCGNEIRAAGQFCSNCGHPSIQPIANQQDPVVPTNPSKNKNHIRSTVDSQNTSSAKMYSVKPKRKKPKRGVVIFAAILLMLAILVQYFAYPFLASKLTFGYVSTLSIQDSKPGDDENAITQAEVSKVRKYAGHIKNTYAWQLSGSEKKLFDLYHKKLKNASSKGSGNISGTLSVSFVSLGGYDNGLSREQVSAEMASVAAILRQCGYEKLSISLLAAAAEGSTIDPSVINNLACALRGTDLNQDAYKLLSYAFRLAPGNVDVLVNLGNTCLDMGDYDRASAWFSEALSIDDEFGLAHEGLMLCYMAEENYPVAMRHMIKASKQCFTPAIQKTYDKLKYLENYGDIRDQVLKGFSFSDIAETYERSRTGSAWEGIDVPENQLSIPKFPVYANIDTFMSSVESMHDFAMSLLEPGIGEVNELLSIANTPEFAQSFETGDIKKILEAIGIGISESEDKPTATMEGDLLILPITNEREAFTVHLMGDYLDMKIQEYTDVMLDGFEKKTLDPILSIHERNQREMKSRGLNAAVWLTEMANNWGNSGSLDNTTIKDNKVNLNQHLEAFYQSVLPAYNALKPELEEYWLRTGGVIKYTSDDKIFNSLEKERRIKVSGVMAIFGMMAETEVINVPLMYFGTAAGGNAVPVVQTPELLEMPDAETKSPETVISFDFFGVLSVEITDSEVSAELSLLLSAGVKHNIEKGTTTFIAGTALNSGDFVPGVSGGVGEYYYWTVDNWKVTDHGQMNKKTYGVNASLFKFGASYSETITTKVSDVTSCTKKTVEKMVGAKLGVSTIGKKIETDQ